MAQPAVRPMPTPGMPLPPGVMPQPPPMPMPSNPALQNLLDSLPTQTLPFKITNQPIPNTNPPQTGTLVLCPSHNLQVCEVCGVDYGALNYMHQFLKNAPSEAVPPPPNMAPPPQRAEAIKQAKEAGNTAFKAQNFPLAVQHYSRSADMALSRPPWELAALSRDESSIALCNRSAAFAFAGAW